MSKYQAVPGSKIIGAYIMGAVEALGVYKNTGYQILAECGLPNPKADQMYPLQIFCDFFEAVGNKIGPSTLLTMGRKVGGGFFNLPAEVTDVDEMFKTLNPGLTKATQGLKDQEVWKFTKTGPNSATVSFHGAFPDPFIRGLLEGMGAQVLKGPRFSARVDSTVPSIDNGGQSTTLQCAW